jgi:uncharacterized protein YndB with AHSA1/START domain
MSGNKTTITAEPNGQELFIIREFDYPKELVFKTFVDPKLLAMWLGPRRLTTDIKVFQPKNGGSYRYISREQNGDEYVFHGVFHLVQANEKIIQTFQFQFKDIKGGVSLDTATFETLANNRTKFTIQSVYQSVADRNLMMHSNMEKGVNEGHERLDELLNTL